MPVSELLARTPAAELTEWMVYEEQAGPLGGRRDDLLAGLVCTTIANANRGKKGRKYRVEDFTPTWGPKRTQTWQEQLAAVEQLNRTMGGKDQRPR